MNKTFYATLAYILLGLSVIAFILFIYAFVTEGSFSLKTLSIGAGALAGGLALLAEVRNQKEKEEEKEEGKNE